MVMMKKRGGVRKGVGRPRGRKPTTPDAAVMTLYEVAEYLHCDLATVYKLARQGKIPRFRLPGGNWRFLKSELDEWMAKGGGQE
jgi:excisionase family DNA binding protein